MQAWLSRQPWDASPRRVVTPVPCSQDSASRSSLSSSGSNSIKPHRTNCLHKLLQPLDLPCPVA